MQVMETQLRSLRDMTSAWVRNPVQAACDLEELAGTTLALWRLFRSNHLAKSAAYDEEAEVRRAYRNRDIAHLFRDLIELFAVADERLRADGQTIRGLDDLAVVRAELADLLSVSLDEVIAAHQEAKAGKGRSAQDVRRDLQRRLRQQG